MAWAPVGMATDKVHMACATGPVHYFLDLRAETMTCGAATECGSWQVYPNPAYRLRRAALVCGTARVGRMVLALVSECWMLVVVVGDSWCVVARADAHFSLFFLLYL